MLDHERLRPELLQAALAVKGAAGQVNVLIHAVGILLSLPHILGPGERIEYLSLGAGNTGRDFDLQTDRRVAEFKFISWRGGPESIRQNGVFQDLFKLLSDTSGRQRCLYLTGTKEALRFLNGNRALDSVLSKNQAIRESFINKHGDRYRVVSEYFRAVKDQVQIIDLKAVVPNLWGAVPLDSLMGAATRVHQEDEASS